MNAWTTHRSKSAPCDPRRRKLLERNRAQSTPAITTGIARDLRRPRINRRGNSPPGLGQSCSCQHPDLASSSNRPGRYNHPETSTDQCLNYIHSIRIDICHAGKSVQQGRIQPAPIALPCRLRPATVGRAGLNAGRAPQARCPGGARYPPTSRTMQPASLRVCAHAGRDDAGGVVLLDDHRAFPPLRKVGAGDHGGLAPAVFRAEIGAPGRVCPDAPARRRDQFGAAARQGGGRGPAREASPAPPAPPARRGGRRCARARRRRPLPAPRARHRRAGRPARRR